MFSEAACAKFGCEIEQPAASLRPTTVNNWCTVPSGMVVPGWLMKRASRIGPVALSNVGMVLVAPLYWYTLNSGFDGGLDPPTAGYAWQVAHEFALNLGPSPPSVGEVTITSCTRSNSAVMLGSICCSLALSVPRKVPAVAGSGRGPGSVAVGHGDGVHVVLPFTTDFGA